MCLWCREQLLGLNCVKRACARSKAVGARHPGRRLSAIVHCLIGDELEVIFNSQDGCAEASREAFLRILDLKLTASPAMTIMRSRLPRQELSTISIS
jgi:hypothetical protein